VQLVRKRILRTKKKGEMKYNTLYLKYIIHTHTHTHTHIYIIHTYRDTERERREKKEGGRVRLYHCEKNLIVAWKRKEEKS
jgi:hypothetical protein